jgi:hypothetical protein
MKYIAGRWPPAVAAGGRGRFGAGSFAALVEGYRQSWRESPATAGASDRHQR